ncbi:MAG: ABC transporter substrate-binding protein [Thermomicrobiales bacterium]
MSNPTLTRRRMVQGGAGIAGAALLGLGGSAQAKPLNPATYQFAPAQSLTGKVVVGINSNVQETVKKALSDAYKERQPGVEITWETAHRTPDEYVSWLGTQLAADPPELDIVSANYVPTYRGYVNLDQYRGTTNPYTNQLWDADLNWDFSRSLNAAGERIMLATRSVHISWFYNKEFFAKAGVEPPTTWTGFADVCAKLKAAGVTPIGINYDYQLPQWFAEVYFDQYHVNWVETVRSQEGDWNYDPDLDGTFKMDPTNPDLHNSYTYNQQRFYKGMQDGTLRFDTPEMTELVTNLAQIFPKYANEDIFVAADIYPKFLQQQVAIIPDGSWSIGQLTADLAALSPERLKELKIEPGKIKTFTWDTFENPAMEGNLVKSQPRSVESSTGEYIGIVAKEQKQTDLSVDFAMYWLSATGYQPYVDAQWKVPGFSPGGPLQVKGVKVPAEEDKLFGGLKMLGNAEANYNGFWTAGAGGQYTKDAHNLLAQALQGKISPEEFGKQLQAFHTKNFAAYLELASLTQADVNDPTRQPGT